MNTKLNKQIIVIALLMATCGIGRSQSFVNLRFESPVLPLVPDGGFQVPIANALPGWTGYIGGSQVSSVAYNAVSIGAPSISLQGTGSTFPPIQGNYSVLFQPYFSTVAIGQVGQIPSNANSLQFYSGSGSLQASFAGQAIPLVQLGSTSNYLIFGGDVSAWAGTSGELRFTLPSIQFTYGEPFLDNIFFSTQSIPEPSTYSLFGCGVLLLGAARAAFKRKP